MCFSQSRSLSSRVIGGRRTSSRGVGFTGWIGGLAVFDLALSAEELAKLHALAAAAI
jgi:hypothetical protein